jgi:hypothetical protein
MPALIRAIRVASSGATGISDESGVSGGRNLLEIPVVVTGNYDLEVTFMQLKGIAHDYNITQKLITVTEDKAFICLQRNLKSLGRRRWLHPLSLLLTMLLALATSDFDKLRWMSSELLKATFIVTSSITAAWLIWEIMHEGKLKEMPEAIGDIFAELRS